MARETGQPFTLGFYHGSKFQAVFKREHLIKATLKDNPQMHF
jgi:hypothetical protein